MGTKRPAHARRIRSGRSGVLVRDKFWDFMHDEKKQIQVIFLVAGLLAIVVVANEAAIIFLLASAVLGLDEGEW
jgi:hypothetical protein